MTDTKINSATDALALASDPAFDLDAWQIGRSGELAPGIEVWTSWLPVSGYYETLVIGEELLADFNYVSRTDSRLEAQNNHALVVQRLQRHLSDQEVV